MPGDGSIHSDKSFLYQNSGKNDSKVNDSEVKPGNLNYTLRLKHFLLIEIPDSVMIINLHRLRFHFTIQNVLFFLDSFFS